MLWAYIFQQNSNYEYGNWVKGIIIPATYIADGKIFEYRFGPGITGFIKEVYTSDHLEDNYSFQLFKNTFGISRYNWFASDYHIEPYYFDPGWGNGYVLHVDSGEEWDDGNNNNLDGWTDLCVIENGWNWVNNAGLTSTTCTPIWGDQFNVLGEVCDDGIKNDNRGCLSDWSGVMNGWYCSGGDHTKPDICNEQCNDGYITSGEQWEDGNINNLDGWSSSWQIEVGWTCTNNAGLPSSVWKSIWGDGLIVGPETCDDGLDDTEGCNSNCNGEINGWYCTLTGNNPDSVWVTHLMDGIRVNGREDWDDGNAIDIGDGWTNSGTIEYKWIWNDNLLQRSICEPLWGDGVQDHPDEKWDDGNYGSGDGCSKGCLIENGWQWFNG